MAENITPIKTFEDYRVYVDRETDYFWTTHWYLETHRSPVGHPFRVKQSPMCNYPPEGVAPEDLDRFKDYCNAEPNDLNWWLYREAMRFWHGHYQPVSNLIYGLRNLPENVRLRYVYHFVHLSTDDPTMIAYTPSHQYGLADRQVKMKLGRYLQKFYADVLTQEQIRDIANNIHQDEIKWAVGPEAIREVYENCGIQSCMEGDDCRVDNMHPVEVYGYQEADGSYRLGLAYLGSPNGASARCLCDMKNKAFVRYYGNDGEILASRLKDLGYEKVDGFGGLGIKLQCIDLDCGGWLMPYLDGCHQRVEGPLYDSATQRDYFLWSDTGKDAANANGIMDGDDDNDDDDEHYSYCDCCDSRVHNDDLSYSEHHDHDICSYCRDEHYVYAYYGQHGDETYVRIGSAIQVGENWYLDRQSVLDYHGIVLDVDGDYQDKDYCTELYDGRYASDGHDDLVQLIDDKDGDERWALSSDSSVVELVGGDWALDDDEGVVELYNGDYALEEDCVQCADESWMLLNDTDCRMLYNGEFAHVADTVELIDGKLAWDQDEAVVDMSPGGFYWFKEADMIQCPDGTWDWSLFHPELVHAARIDAVVPFTVNEPEQEVCA
jgi:hypothetical protein